MHFNYFSIWYSGIKLRNYAAACPDEQIAAYVFDVLRTGRPADILYGVGEPEEKRYDSLSGRPYYGRLTGRKE